MTDKEIQDLLSLKKYEQPEEGYFDDFLVEFQQRQRSEMLKTSARGLLLERAKAWFSEFGVMRWVIGAGAAYAAVALVFNVLPGQTTDAATVATIGSEMIAPKENAIPAVSIEHVAEGEIMPVSMVFSHPVDFSGSAPAFSAEERIF